MPEPSIANIDTIEKGQSVQPDEQGEKAPVNLSHDLFGVYRVRLGFDVEAELFLMLPLPPGVLNGYHLWFVEIMPWLLFRGAGV